MTRSGRDCRDAGGQRLGFEFREASGVGEGTFDLHFEDPGLVGGKNLVDHHPMSFHYLAGIAGEALGGAFRAEEPIEPGGGAVERIDERDGAGAEQVAGLVDS